MGESIGEFLDEHEEDRFPATLGPWIEEDEWDPRFMRETIRKAERLRWIEVDRADPNNWKYRFTITGSLAKANSQRGKPSVDSDQSVAKDDACTSVTR